MTELPSSITLANGFRLLRNRQSSSHLMRLPIDIRLIILEQLLCKDRVIRPREMYDRPWDHGGSTEETTTDQRNDKYTDQFRLCSQLLACCQLLYEECYAILFGENKLMMLSHHGHHFVLYTCIRSPFSYKGLPSWPALEASLLPSKQLALPKSHSESDQISLYAKQIQSAYRRRLVFCYHPTCLESSGGPRFWPRNEHLRRHVLDDHKECNNSPTAYWTEDGVFAPCVVQYGLEPPTDRGAQTQSSANVFSSQKNRLYIPANRSLAIAARFKNVILHVEEKLIYPNVRPRRIRELIGCCRLYQEFLLDKDVTLVYGPQLPTGFNPPGTFSEPSITTKDLGPLRYLRCRSMQYQIKGIQNDLDDNRAELQDLTCIITSDEPVYDLLPEYSILIKNTIMHLPEVSNNTFYQKHKHEIAQWDHAACCADPEAFKCVKELVVDRVAQWMNDWADWERDRGRNQLEQHISARKNKVAERLDDTNNVSYTRLNAGETTRSSSSSGVLDKASCSSQPGYIGLDWLS